MCPTLISAPSIRSRVPPASAPSASARSTLAPRKNCATNVLVGRWWIASGVLEASNDIRIIFTDIDMPGSMNGLKLAHAVANRWPPIRIIATSGHFRIGERDLPDGGRFIAKPYRQHQIIGALTEFANPRSAFRG